MTDTGTQWQRVRATFERLVDLSDLDRSSALEQLTREDADIATEVRRLLDADSDQGLPELDTAAARALREHESLRLADGARIEGFQIVRFLARGGMGAVYEALQLQPARTVALKVLRPELSVGSGLRRFEAEARVLARLEHQNIAKVLAAGVHAQETGPFALELPWYALEFIADAQAITKHAQAHRISLRRRVEWMAAIADAIQHAHRRGVIHRDLKPGNLLVGRDGVPKIVDFGIARSDEDAAEDPRTAAGVVLGTPAYMSPEQRSGLPDLDSRTDVFALGKVLAELCADDSALERDRELGWILARATAEDRERRYGTAAEFAADLRAWLAGDVLLAAPPSRRYRLRKFLAHHRAMVAAIAAVVLALAAGLVVSLKSLDRVRASEAVAKSNEAEARAARATAERNAEALAEEKATVAGVVDVLRATVTRAIGTASGRDASIADFCDELEHEIAREDLSPRTRALTANYLAAVRFANGDWQSSAELSRVALDLMASAGLTATNDGILAHGALSESLRKLGRTSEAAQALEAGWKLAVAELEPTSPIRLSMQRKVMLLALESGRATDALKLAEELRLLRFRSGGADDRATLEAEIDLATCRLAARTPDAIPNALATLQRCGEAVDPPLDVMLSLRTNLGVVMARGKDFGGAVEQIEQALLGYRQRLPNDHPTIAATLANLGAIQLEAGDTAAAVESLRSAVDAQAVRLPALHPQRIHNLAVLSRALRLDGRAAAAIAEIESHTRPLAVTPVPSITAMIELRTELGFARLSNGDDGIAQDLHRRLLAECAELPKDGVAIADRCRARILAEYARRGLEPPVELK
ncbi:MAG: protein kinase [Planctomycetota bacterium]